MFEHTTTSGTHWERQTIQKVLLEHLIEQRRARRWGIFFKILFLILLFFIAIWLFTGGPSKELPPPVTTKSHTALVDVKGAIEEDEGASADNVRSSLKLAFENKHVKGIVLRINSPGGSPVQARRVYSDIVYFKSKYPNTKIYAVIEELGTSAAYLIASATDAIYADKTSLVGSIGVRLDSFGFVEAMNKLGVERRLYAAGKYKGILDPFSPNKPEEAAFINGQLAEVHQAFINNVREGRGNRLKETPDIFSGLFWTGEDALKLGLIDGFGDAHTVAREIVKEEELIDYTPTASLLDRLANRLGASIAKTVLKNKVSLSY